MRPARGSAPGPGATEALAAWCSLALAAGASDVVQAVVAAVAAEWVGANAGAEPHVRRTTFVKKSPDAGAAGLRLQSLRAAAGGASPLWRALCEEDWRATRGGRIRPPSRARCSTPAGWLEGRRPACGSAKRTVLLPEDLLDEHARWYYRFREVRASTGRRTTRGGAARRLAWFSARTAACADPAAGDTPMRASSACAGASRVAARAARVGERQPGANVQGRPMQASWHFVVTSCWGVYMCGDMPRRGSGAPELEDDALGTSVQDQIGEAAVYNELLGSTDDAQPAFLALDDEIDGGGRGAGRGTARASRGAGPPSVKLWHDRAQEMTLERLAEHFAGGIYEAAAELAAELE